MSFPFLIVRQMCGVHGKHLDFMRELLEINRKYPGSCDEYWMDADTPFCYPTLETERPYNEEFREFREECEKAGIAMGFQRCPTLGHCVMKLSDQTQPTLGTNDMQIDAQGKLLEGLLCPTSPNVLEYVYERTKATLEALRPSSFWIDDDLRMGVCKPEGCFCPRCLEQFNAETGGNWTREELAHHLNDQTGDFEPVRAQWCQFHARNNALVMEAYRRAVDEVMPECRLGWQTTMQTWTYNGLDYTPAYRAMSGPRGCPANIRPGGGYYFEDTEIKTLLGKAFETLVATARAVQYPLMEQICYEAENYPHTGQLKSARMMMTECAFMLGCGCNSITVYWHDHENREPRANYEHFAKTCAEWRPFLEALADRLPGTMNSGVTQLVGPSQANMPNQGRPTDDWRCYGMWNQMAQLWKQGVPMTAPDGASDIRLGILTERQIGGYTDDELRQLLQGNVVLDALVLERLNERMPDWPVTPVKPMDPNPCLMEVFPNGRSCWNFAPLRAIQVQDETAPGVRVFSRIGQHYCSVIADNATPPGIGFPATVLVPTRFGGRVLVIGGLGFWEYGNFDRIAVLREALDAAATKPLPIRLLSAHPVSPVVRVDAEGRTKLVVLMNDFLEETDGLQVIVRRPRGTSARWLMPLEESTVLTNFPAGTEEITLTLPPIPARGIAAIALE